MKKQQLLQQFPASRLSRNLRKQITGGGIGTHILPCYAVYHTCHSADGAAYQAKTECCEKDSTQCKLTCA
jgi:hypothetical protein